MPGSGSLGPNLCRRCLGLGSCADALSGMDGVAADSPCPWAAACRWQVQAEQIKLRMIMWIGRKEDEKKWRKEALLRDSITPRLRIPAEFISRRAARCAGRHCGNLAQSLMAVET